MTTYWATSEAPPLVRRATALAERFGFAQSCTPETGRLLRVLAAQVRDGVVGEMGTGCGVGAAWLASALAPGVSLVTIELDAARATAARELFADVPAVHVLHGDWRELLPHGPFALLFADGGKAKQHEPDALVAALRPGGLLVLDDLTPVDQWPAAWRGKPDPVREFWLNDPRLAATELLVSPRMAVIVAARLR
ncbi:MAG TPA: class I SAM-dependent methyltransferase [Thermomicrobiales bacterium]|nr:class I SAM-dependent methyltransferase [Thermomicrobiales bacterium]